MRLLTMTFPLAGQGKAFIAGDARQGLQPLLHTVPKAFTKTDCVTKPACMPGQTTSSQCHCANNSRSRHIMGSVLLLAIHCSYTDRQACRLTPATRVKMYRCYTCAFKPGFLMGYNWLHTPDCKI